MNGQPKFKICDQVWFLSPRGTIRRGLISKAWKVKERQENMRTGRIIDCETYMYDISNPSYTKFEEELFSSEQELREAIDNGLIE